MLCEFIGTHQRLGGTYCLHLLAALTHALQPRRPTLTSLPPWECRINTTEILGHISLSILTHDGRFHFITHRTRSDKAVKAAT
jgi:hypothetical protein